VRAEVHDSESSNSDFFNLEMYSSSTLQMNLVVSVD
jgi:hypothetical protein